MEVVFKRKKIRPHATFLINHNRKSDTQQTSHTAAMAKRDLDSTNDTEVLEKNVLVFFFPRKTADHL